MFYERITVAHLNLTDEKKVRASNEIPSQNYVILWSTQPLNERKCARK